jgi:hypothetical protein
MMKAIASLTIGLVLMPLLGSCAAASDSSLNAPMTVKMTPNHPTEPTRIRFDVTNSSHADQQDQRLPVHEQIRLGMRQLASERLPEKGYCQHGFKGPDLVLGKKMSANWFFFVDCLPAPAKASAPTKDVEPKPPPPK